MKFICKTCGSYINKSPVVLSGMFNQMRLGLLPPLPDAAQSTARGLAAGHFAVGDDFNLHQVLQGVIRLF